ncbi:Protease Do-like 9 [Zea mays]|uniref:Protease Do-like 9 n=1 Tax=Zea mays TaxID=4577 RepID=A0A1D6LVZ1_MAIZE|nr:Protease Do-like 9 [Zea mays]
MSSTRCLVSKCWILSIRSISAALKLAPLSVTICTTCSFPTLSICFSNMSPNIFSFSVSLEASTDSRKNVPAGMLARKLIRWWWLVSVHSSDIMVQPYSFQASSCLFSSLMFCSQLFQAAES